MAAHNTDGSPDDTSRDEAWLRDRCVEQEKSPQEVADECRAGTTAISNWTGAHTVSDRDAIWR